MTSEAHIRADEALLDVIMRVVAALAPNQVPGVTLDNALVADLGFDSLRLVELSFALEELFDMQPISIDDAPPIGTVRDIYDYARRKIEVGDAQPASRESVEQWLAEAW
jgi:acyl carrier protein